MAEFDEPARQSMLAFYSNALGLKYLVLLSLAGLFSFVLSLVLVIFARGRSAGIALLLVLAAPLLVGVFGALDGWMASMMLIAMSTTAPRPDAYAHNVACALVVPLIAILVAAPSYLVALVGTIVRAFQRDPH